MSFALVTDSSCDLAPQVAEQLGIYVLPLRIVVGEQYFLDWVEFSPKDATDTLRQGQLLQTYPPRHKAFEELYLRLLEQHDFVVSLHSSAKLSSILQRARRVVLEQRLGARVTVIDSGMTSVALTETVLAVREALLAGADADMAQAVAQRARRETFCRFTLPSMEYLRRAGHLSRSQEMMGNLLGMRPVLGFAEGGIRLFKTVRQGEVLRDMVRDLEEQFGETPLSLGFVYSVGDTERVAQMRELVGASRLKVARGRVQVLGAAVGTRVGPGIYGFSALVANTAERVLRESNKLAQRRLGRH